MTTNQLVSDIRNIATSGSNPVEFKIEDSQILFWCNEIRSMLISQAIQKKQDISDVWIQTIKCMELEQVDESECCDITTGCYILRTVEELPITIETHGDNSILRVTTPKGRIIPKSNAFESNYTEYSKYTKNSTRWFLRPGDRRVYIKNENFLEHINVSLLAENPEDLAIFVDCSGDTCFDYNDSYPCSLKMANDITNIVLKTKVLTYLQLPADNRNDGANLMPPPNTKTE